MSLYIQQKLLNPNATRIQRSTRWAAGFDIYAPEDGRLDPLQRRLVKLGFATAFTKGWAALLIDRSGMGNKGITRFAGLIDPDYRGEWGAVLYNSNPEPFAWKKDDRLIQVIFLQVGLADVEIVETLEDADSDRTGGFGSTGL